MAKEKFGGYFDQDFEFVESTNEEEKEKEEKPPKKK